MTTEKAIRIMAGLFILLSLGLGVSGSPIFVNGNWLWFTAFVGANLFQSALTGFCPAEMVFRKLGMRQAGEAR